MAKQKVAASVDANAAHVMNEFELLQADPILPKAAPPARAAAGIADGDDTTILHVTSKTKPQIDVETSPVGDPKLGLWQVRLRTQKGRFGGGLPGLTGESMKLTDLARHAKKSSKGAEAHTPASLETRFVPKTVPRHIRPTRQAAIPKDNPVSRILAQVFRDELTDQSYPWSTVGRVFVGVPPDYTNWMWSGSGVLVAPNLLLTASHVAPWGRSAWYMRFVPAYRNGSGPFGEAYVSDFRGVSNSSDVTGLDYVICRLYSSIGNQAGWMGSWWWNDDDPYENGTWTSGGYPSDFFGGERPAVETFVRIIDIDNDGDGKELETDRFASPGWSGGPLWGWVDGQPRVIGVESGEETDFLQPRHNVFAGGQHMIDLINFGIATWPQ